MKFPIRHFMPLLGCAFIGFSAVGCRKNTNEIARVQSTPLPKTTATPMSDEHKTTDPDWKTQYPEAANMDWLNEGVWLKGARPFYHSLSFSPDGRWIVGGTSKAFLWDTRTGEVRAHWGKTFTLNGS